jgi:hypothetical protein
MPVSSTTAIRKPSLPLVKAYATEEEMYTKYHKRYYSPVTWKEGNLTLQGFTFKHRYFRSLTKAKKEAEQFSMALGYCTSIIRLPDNRYSFLPSDDHQNNAIERMCRMLGARVVDCCVVWSL